MTIADRMQSGNFSEPNSVDEQIASIQAILTRAKRNHEHICLQQLHRLLAIAYPSASQRPDVCKIANNLFVGKLRFNDACDACSFYELFLQASDKDANLVPF